jgi:hypothetical protein
MRYITARLKANALNGKRFLSVRTARIATGLVATLTPADHFACLIDDAHAGLFY